MKKEKYTPQPQSTILRQGTITSLNFCPPQQHILDNHVKDEEKEAGQFFYI
jgi:hypothetical protein